MGKLYFGPRRRQSARPPALMSTITPCGPWQCGNVPPDNDALTCLSDHLTGEAGHRAAITSLRLLAVFNAVAGVAGCALEFLDFEPCSLLPKPRLRGLIRSGRSFWVRLISASPPLFRSPFQRAFVPLGHPARSLRVGVTADPEPGSRRSTLTPALNRGL